MKQNLERVMKLMEQKRNALDAAIVALQDVQKAMNLGDDLTEVIPVKAIHWMQRPENREKVQKMVKKMHRARRKASKK